MNFLNILIALFVFGIVVAIHELGHFTVAKLNKITVHEFAIGMGPLIFQKKKNETQYSLRAIPMGGYVSMEGEDDESDDPNAFCKKTPLQRISVIFAGPFMNFVLTIVVLIILYSVNGIPVNKIGSILPNSPASKVNLTAGDEIIKINDNDIKSWKEIPQSVENSSGNIYLSVKKDDGSIVVVEISPEEKSGRKTIGIYPKFERAFTKSIPYAFKQTLDISIQMLKFVVRLFTGKIDFNYISGPVGIIREVGSSVGSGLGTVMNYIAFISLNLGIMNLLPIPALDGFRIVTAFCELVTGKKLNKKMEYTVNLTGMVFLILLLLFVTYNDVLKIFVKN